MSPVENSLCVFQLLYQRKRVSFKNEKSYIKNDAKVWNLFQISLHFFNKISKFAMSTLQNTKNYVVRQFYPKNLSNCLNFI